jgi:hypothetical protein
MPVGNQPEVLQRAGDGLLTRVLSESQDRKCDDRKMPVDRFPIFLSSIFRSSLSRCESLGGGAGIGLL